MLKKETRLKCVIPVLTIALFVISFCTAPQNSIEAEEIVPEENVTYILGTIVERDLEDLIENSCLVAEGTITDKSDSFRIESVSGATAIFTDYYLSVQTALRGSADDTITIRVQGGTVNGETEIYTASPSFEVGDKYVVFLYKPGRGGSYNTEGDYYYVLGLSQGVFSESETGELISQAGETIALSDLRMSLASRALAPVNEDKFREEYIENQRLNLENGFITQEEYDAAIDGLDVYATIVE